MWLVKGPVLLYKEGYGAGHEFRLPMSLQHLYPRLRVIVIGSYNTDLVIWCDSIPAEGQSIVGGDFDMYCGGRGANCAVAAARAGCQVKFVGAHGKDLFGKMGTERLARERIDISDFIELPAANTGVAMIYQQRRTGMHSALISTSANNQVPLSLVGKVESAIQKSDLVFTQFEIASPIYLEVFRRCHRYNKRVVVHAAPVQPPINFPTGQYFLLVADDFEALLLTGCDHVYSAIESLHERGVRNVIVKQKCASLMFSDGVMCKVQRIPPAPFVQGTGAAECLTAWAAITLALTNDLECAVNIGAQAMAFSLSREGAQESLPYPTELPIDWKKYAF
jgi:ribokinase